jgi:hypothetical protein
LRCLTHYTPLYLSIINDKIKTIFNKKITANYSYNSTIKIWQNRFYKVILHVLVGHDMARHGIGEVEESVVLGVGGVRVHEHATEHAREAAVPSVDASSSSSTGGAAAFAPQRTGAAAR